ncbi:MAG TPA: hypothetical protein VI873_03575 [Candidatus Peribacteraceae bacterium]|nr:hypothetical protein [Candidatus Peribacteraceae bacterium]
MPQHLPSSLEEGERHHPSGIVLRRDSPLLGELAYEMNLAQSLKLYSETDVARILFNSERKFVTLTKAWQLLNALQ